MTLIVAVLRALGVIVELVLDLRYRKSTADKTRLKRRAKEHELLLKALRARRKERQKHADHGKSAK